MGALELERPRLGRGALISFTSHNIRLDDGTHTKPDAGPSMEFHPWFLAAKRIIDATFPGDKTHLSLVDLGCLEGGYTVEFARLGLQPLVLDVRESNIEVRRCVQSKQGLRSSNFVPDDAWTIANYGSFAVVMCCAPGSRPARPRVFDDALSSVARRLIIPQRHSTKG